MQVLENWHPQGVTVYMDDKRFVKCVLTDCKLIYGGGDVTWENTQFVNCQLTFDGAAQRTVAYLQNFGLMKPPVTNATPSAQPNSGVNCSGQLSRRPSAMAASDFFCRRNSGFQESTFPS